jgi:hypothetical protein
MTGTEGNGNSYRVTLFELNQDEFGEFVGYYYNPRHNGFVGREKIKRKCLKIDCEFYEPFRPEHRRDGR